jgi:hypothetical protein
MMSPKLARMLGVFVGGEHRVTHVREDERLMGSVREEDWVPVLANDGEGWSVLSGDLQMIANPTIVAQFHTSNLIFFCMDENWCSGNSEHSQLWKFFRVWPEIVSRSRGEWPFFYQINTARDRPTIDPLRFSRRARRRRLEI